MLRKILVPVDGSEPSWQALKYAAEIGAKFESELLVAHIVQPFYNASLLALPIDSGLLAMQMDDLKKNAESVLAAAKEKLAPYSVKVATKLETGHPSERILKIASETGCDAIVIGSRGLSGIAEFVLGSVSSNVSQYANVPVLIVKCDKKTGK
ncbi:MAG: universal stress protein [Acidaminococcales bacterium]|jgi:nucleotide-binding universal stress UspA family protein|nr:universal stress protein [Acidaminococcales bacterium]